MTLKTAPHVQISSPMQMVSINSWNGTKNVIVYAKGREKNIKLQNKSSKWKHLLWNTHQSPFDFQIQANQKHWNKLIKWQLLFKVQIALYRKKLGLFLPEAKAQEKCLSSHNKCFPISQIKCFRRSQELKEYSCTARMWHVNFKTHMHTPYTQKKRYKYWHWLWYLFKSYKYVQFRN